MRFLSRWGGRRTSNRQAKYTLSFALRSYVSSAMDRILEGLSFMEDFRRQASRALFGSRQADKHHRRQMFRMSLGNNLEQLEGRALMAGLTYSVAGSTYSQNFDSLPSTTAAPASVTVPMIWVTPLMRR